MRHKNRNNCELLILHLICFKKRIHGFVYFFVEECPIFIQTDEFKGFICSDHWYHNLTTDFLTHWKQRESYILEPNFFKHKIVFLKAECFILTINYKTNKKLEVIYEMRDTFRGGSIKVSFSIFRIIEKILRMGGGGLQFLKNLSRIFWMAP